MIVFDLKCAKDHVFEAWFSDTAGFEDQRDAGDVACPLCGDRDIEKSLMSPSVPAKTSDRENAQTAAQMLYQMRDHVQENCDYVGDKFAEEARKIHYGETDQRDIYGEATPQEASDLKDEDIDFGVLPWPDREDA
jgi:hypothetical protein